jgi:hypothetical protein
MKTLKYIIGALVLAAGLTACVGDLDVKPIDPSMNTADKALVTEEDYFSLLAQCYTGFATSGFKGPNGDNAISGIDGGFSQYFRGRYHLNGLTTDEAVCGWNDQTLQDLHGMAWTTTDVFVAAFYYRIFYLISAFNEFIRQADKATIELPEKALWIAEARTLRAFCWLDAIDNYGNVPFADETAVVGADIPKQISRKDLFNYIESECLELLEGSDLYEVGQSPYGRVNKGTVIMILAKLYLNAEVYTGTAKYQECADVLAKLDGKYSLHNKYQELFLADNHKCTDEIIWSVEQDGNDVQSYGVTNYLIFACTGGDMDTKEIGISSGWGGLRTTPEFYKNFSDNDARKLFFTEKEQEVVLKRNYDTYVADTKKANEEGKKKDPKFEEEKIKTYEDWLGEDKKWQQADIELVSEFTHGYGIMKFKNINSDGTKGKAEGFVDTDFPVFRYADALLMKAECAKRGATGVDGLAAFNAVRKRAGLSEVQEYSLENVLQERACELYMEGWRRSDLVRFGKFTSASKLWQWKGGVKAGKGVSAHLNLFPIPSNDLNANSNLVQNSGY